MAPFIVRLMTSANINRFQKFFYCQNQETICNKTVTIDPTTPQVCRCTTSWNITWRLNTIRSTVSPSRTKCRIPTGLGPPPVDGRCRSAMGNYVDPQIRLNELKNK